MVDSWQRLDAVETDAHLRLAQQEVEFLTIEERAIMFGELKGYAQEKGYKTGWAVMKFKDRFGDWPSDDVKATPSLAPTETTRIWIEAVTRDWWRSRPRKRK